MERFIWEFANAAVLSTPIGVPRIYDIKFLFVVIIPNNKDTMRLHIQAMREFFIFDWVVGG
ncbi:MAG: hypothetical protein DBX95_09350 [Oscillibacter sp.]|nr:MAG: hypothetical protein DBX95_09350 [Oscillibacter sp.]